VQEKCCDSEEKIREEIFEEVGQEVGEKGQEVCEEIRQEVEGGSAEEISQEGRRQEGSSKKEGGPGSQASRTQASRTQASRIQAGGADGCTKAGAGSRTEAGSDAAPGGTELGGSHSGCIKSRTVMGAFGRRDLVEPVVFQRR
jgi:hypothetical protein